MIAHAPLHTIQMVDLKSQYASIKEEIDQAIAETIRDAHFINGPAVVSFTQALSQYNRVPYTVMCGNGTDALQIALMALGLRPSDEVLVPAFTYVATAEVIALLGLRPVFVDVDSDTFNINTELIADVCSKQTKAIMPVHLFGQCAGMEALLDLAKEFNLYIIEDAAQSIGAEYRFSDKPPQKAGTIGTIGSTSFFPSKNLGCYGDGGALFTHNEELAETMHVIANHGQRTKYCHDLIGVNSRLDTLQAAILQVKLHHLDDYIQKRQTAARYYDEVLGELPMVKIPVRSAFSSHVFNQYTIQVPASARNTLKLFLQAHDIPSMVYYPLPLHLQKAYQTYGYKPGDFPVAEALTRQVLSLPIHTELNEIQLEYITDHIKQFFYGK